MSQIPREKTLDSTLALLSEGYTFISRRCECFQSDIFRTRLMFTPAVCVLGEEAARIVYDPDRFTRRDALPITMLTLLLDKGSVELLDDEGHRHRKRMFVSLMTRPSMQQLVDLMADEWRAFDWQGHRFSQGDWVLLDLYGTNHDRRIWGDPEAFRPERFREWNGSAFNFIPQGGGDHHHTHRCAGEWITIELMKEAVRLLTREMRYAVPPQDLRIRLSRMPAIPQSRFVINHVARAH